MEVRVEMGRRTWSKKGDVAQLTRHDVLLPIKIPRVDMLL